MIPKVIHQIWLGDQSKRPTPLMETWKEKNPTWEHKIWTEKNMPKLKCQKQFDALKDIPGRADILRYEILFNEGGFYVDADSVCLEPLDDFFVDNDSFCCYENEKARPGLMANGYLGATKGNKMMEYLIHLISNIDPGMVGSWPVGSAWRTVGPALLTELASFHKYTKLKVYPSWYFIPEHYSGEKYEGDEKVYGEQYYMSTHSSGRGYDEFKS